MNLDLVEGGFSLACASLRVSDRRAHLLRHRRMYVQRLVRRGVPVRVGGAG